MDLETKGLDRKYIIDHLSVKTYPVPGLDVYNMRIYFKGAFIYAIEVDGMELEMWRYKDNPDPDEEGLTEEKFDNALREIELQSDFTPPVDTPKVKRWENPLLADEEGLRKLARKDCGSPTCVLCKRKDMKKAKALVNEVTRKEGWE